MKRIVIYLMAVLVLGGCVSSGRKAAMRAELDSINAVNRSGQPFTVAAVKPYVEFFDDHGTPNDRLLAHYLLGLAYYDHGEAPMALQCYQEALDCADTTATDCDYAQLCRVYMQMANVFYYQGLYRKQLEYIDNSVKYAWKGKDTLAALMSYEQKTFGYQRLGLIDSAIVVIEDVAKKYEQYGYSAQAAIALGTIVRTLVDRGEYKKAKEYMDRYESESGRFNHKGDIEPGREIHYKTKGLYYLYNNMADSAEYYFRKDLRDGKDFNNQNAAAMGLALLYQRLHRTDSASKYAIYAYAMNDSMYAQQTTETVERMQSMYDYSRHQKEAQQEKEKATRRANIIWICIGFIIISGLVVVISIRELARKKEQSEQKYLQGQAIIEQAQQDIAKLCKNEEINKELISEKEQTIREQETILKSILHHDNISQSMAEKRLKSTNIYKTFKQLYDVGHQPSNEEWDEIQNQLYAHYPGFAVLMKEHDCHLADNEKKICLLIRLGFKPANIASMIGVTPSHVTGLRSRMSKELFGLPEDSKIFDKMLRAIY